MSDDLKCLAEKLIILVDFSTTLSSQIYSMKQVFESPAQSEEQQNIPSRRPQYLKDQGLLSIIKSMMKKFPETIQDMSKLPSYSSLVNYHREIYDSLAKYYKIFDDFIDFRDKALSALIDCSKLVTLTHDVNPSIVEKFHELFSRLVLLTYYLSTVEDKKMIVALYAKSFQMVNGSTERNYSRVAQCIVGLEKPLAALQETLIPICSTLSNSLVLIKQNIMASYSSAEKIRKEGWFSIVQVPANLKSHVLDDSVYDSFNPSRC